MAKTLRDPERRPTHPGEILRQKRGVTPDMAIRLGKLLGNGPEIWLRMQQSVDIWALEQRGGYECIEQLQVA